MFLKRKLKLIDSVKENIKSSHTNLSKKIKFKNALCKYNSELDKFFYLKLGLEILTDLVLISKFRVNLFIK
jgi:hypothetical protein